MMAQPMQVLNQREKTVLELRSIYTSYGYRPFKMNQFEAYDLYAENKSFLLSENVITFTDASGQLMALKPDVTLSIVKSARDGGTEKVCYDENVYRTDPASHEFREIMQAGLECIGDVDAYCSGEVVLLALKSLQTICPDFILDLSHMGYLSGLFDDAALTAVQREQMMKCLCSKSKGGVSQLCAQFGVDAQRQQILCQLAEMYEPVESALAQLESMSLNPQMTEAVEQLKELYAFLQLFGYAPYVRIDFSAGSDMQYYSGIVFRGFVSGCADCVLSGGRYDGLVRKLKRHGGAIGFAVYLDRIERMSRQSREHDVEVLIVYDADTPLSVLAQQVKTITQQGKSVSVQRVGNEDGTTYVQRLDLTQKGADRDA